MPHFSGYSKTFEQWREDMIGNFGDEITSEPPDIWQDIHSTKTG